MLASSTGSNTPYRYARGWPPGRRSPRRGSNGGGRGRFGAPARMRGALGKFFLGERGAAAIETALSVSVLVVALAGIMQVVTTVFVDDQAERAARAAARALALDPGADPWEPVREELHADANHTCTTDWTASDLGACDGWTLAVRHGVSPAALTVALDPDLPAPAAGGDLVLVGLSRQPANPNLGSSRTVAELVGMDAVGVARSEPGA